MFELLPEAIEQLRSGEPVALATVVGAHGSSPRDPGASMLVLTDGTVYGSVSGGCVEGAVYEIGQQVLADGVPVLQEFGYSDADAFAVGLTCGGVLHVFVQRIEPAAADELQRLADDVAAGDPVAWATVVDHPDVGWLGRHVIVRPDSHEGSLGTAFADHAIVEDVRGVLAAGTNRRMRYGAEGERMGNEMGVFVASFQPPPRMLIFGAVDFAEALAEQAAFLGYHVTVCDARAVFATKQRFPAADEVVVNWPHRYVRKEAEAGRINARTVACILTHDAKFDVPVLKELTGLPDEIRPFYIGVMGSRRTHDDRERRLREAGLGDTELAMLSSPIGLRLGGRTPQETAVSIVAEIIALRWGGAGEPLSQTQEPIHIDSEYTAAPIEATASLGTA